MQPIIKVENLGKSYLIGHQRESYVALRDVLANKTRQMVSKTKNILAGGQLIAGNEIEEFWALKDINFEVQQGDRVGIIGRNGAGKSTLLKVLSRITEPTTGSIRLRGRVASLLEVGTGFHPELSGRENIYLNGAILGMSQVEVRKKFDEIVDFAGVEKFLDTPVKRYSSGMYVRLAFAVAAHLEPEILIIDEVLAVGDAEFQKKCLGKMEDVSKNDGRTVLFVSHNMEAISNLCNTGIYLTQGLVKFEGTADETVSTYLKDSKSSSPVNLIKNRTDRDGSNKLKIIDFFILDSNNQKVNRLYAGNDYTFNCVILNNIYPDKSANVVLSIDIIDPYKQKICLLFRSNFNKSNFDIYEKQHIIKCSISNFPLTIGEYYFSLFLANDAVEIYDWIQEVYPFEVIGGNFFGTGSFGLPSHCKVLHNSGWENLS